MIFGIFSLKGCEKSQGMLAQRTLIKIAANDGALSEPAGVITGNTSGIFYIEGANSTCRTTQVLRPVLRTYKLPEVQWSFTYGYHGKPHGNNSIQQVITVGNCIGVFSGKKDAGFRDNNSLSPETKLVARVDTRLATAWPDALIKIRKDIIDSPDPQSSYICILSHTEMPHNILILTRNCRSTNIRVFPKEKCLLLGKGTTAEKFKIFEAAEDGLTNSQPIIVPETGGLLLDLKGLRYTKI